MDINLIKELRERTGAGINECKKALAETGEDIEKAIQFLREKGAATAVKKASRIASEGVTDTVSESVVIDEVVANNFFTRKYNQGDKSYTNIKRKAYIFKKENYMGNGVNVYVDVNSGLIIGGRAFGD